ncbi:C-C motif chemokine 4-like [Siniperca chuatsi]|uniref:C-C motif chemokine 4-like n=1 Tax=Siniperca chuatsi TaxID=119488 RepID=UPI001CE09B25|nr:C-C motif chemokine 4-like [Siniperca chuatsi]
MHFSIIFEMSVMCVTVLLFLPVQGQLQNATQKTPMLMPVAPSCCVKVSMAHIEETVCKCFEQKEDRFGNCKVHAYIFITESDKQFCVDPTASWLPERLRKLEKKGIICKIL